METDRNLGVMHPLHAALIAAANGQFPTVDGSVEVFAPADGVHAVFEFTGHTMVLTDRDATALTARGADGFGGSSQPDVIRWLAGPTGVVGSHDVVLVALGRGVVGHVDRGLPVRTDLDQHPRVERARHHRRDVRVHGDADGYITLGQGLVDRLEMSVELLVAHPNAGVGGRLINDALGLVPAGELIWAQVAPGNAASLRAFLTCGFVPIGAETLIAPARVGDAAAVVSHLANDQGSC